MLASSTLAVLSLIAVAFAADPPPDVPPVSGNYLIPDDVSDGCQAFLTKLNDDTNLKGCLTMVTSATAAFANASATVQASDINAAFDTLCSSANACSELTIRPQLTDFGLNCADDFDNDNIVSGLYDMLYAVLPIQRAMCVKDASTGAYCATQKTTSGANTLNLPDYSPQALFGAELGDLGGASVPFLFVDTDTDQSVLCSQCFKDVLQVYVTYEDSIQYVVGVNQSPLLQNQGQIWRSFASKCGDTLAGDVAINAGAAPPTSAASPRASARSVSALVAALSVAVGVALF